MESFSDWLIFRLNHFFIAQSPWLIATEKNMAASENNSMKK